MRVTQRQSFSSGWNGSESVLLVASYTHSVGPKYCYHLFEPRRGETAQNLSLVAVAGEPMVTGANLVTSYVRHVYTSGRLL